MEQFDFTILHEDVHGDVHKFEITCNDEEQAIEVFYDTYPDNKLLKTN